MFSLCATPTVGGGALREAVGRSHPPHHRALRLGRLRGRGVAGVLRVGVLVLCHFDQALSGLVAVVFAWNETKHLPFAIRNA